MKVQNFSRKYHYLVGLLFVMLSSYPSCLKASKMYNLRDVKITGKVLDTNIKSFENGETIVKVMISKYPINGKYMGRGQNKIYKATVKYNQAFSFTFPALAERFYMVISYTPKIGSNHWHSRIANVYILDHGDDISCTLKNDSFDFSGKGAEKLNCQTELYKVKFDIPRSLLEPNKYSERFELMANMEDSCLNVRKQIIERYRPKLGNELSEIFLGNAIGLTYYFAFNRPFVYGQGIPKQYAAFLESKTYQNIDSIRYPKTSPNLLAAAPLYTDFLLEKIKVQNRKYVNGKLENYFSKELIKRVFDDVNRTQKGIIREKLIASLYLSWPNVPAIKEYYDISLKIVNNELFRQIILDHMEKNKRGQQFYPFSLKDVKGKTVKLEDIDDKVVVVDFWYTGCTNCAYLKNNMQVIWNAYKDHPKVEFLSISIDKNFDTWKKSVASGIYTEPTSINLYTNGLGKDHPLIKDLGITAYPRTLMLANGKIFSASIPHPEAQDLNSGTTKDLKNLIEAAILEIK